MLEYKNDNFPKEPTHFDLARIEKAQKKRERKANKLAFTKAESIYSLTEFPFR